MRKLSFSLFLFLFSSQIILAQNFEGKIIYQVSYKSKSPSLTDEQLKALSGSQYDYFIKNGNYKTVVSAGAMLQWQLFLQQDNKLYNKFANSETIFWNDARINQDSVLSFQLNKEVAEVNGYKCDELILTCKSGVQKYYFSTKLKIDPALFSNHKYGNWYDYLSKAGAISLKHIFDLPQFTMESIASEIVPMPLDDAIFTLPANAKTAKSPF
jgi:hypothetical protein